MRQKKCDISLVKNKMRPNISLVIVAKNRMFASNFVLGIPRRFNQYCRYKNSLRGCLYGGGPALLVGLALFAEIPRLS